MNGTIYSQYVYDTSVKRGRNIKYYDNGNTNEINVYDSKGIVSNTKYHENGKIDFKLNRPESLSKLTDDKGNVLKSIQYDATYYDKNGTFQKGRIAYLSNNPNKKLIGQWSTYNANNILLELVNYSTYFKKDKYGEQQNVLHGKWAQFYSNGSKKAAGTYNNGLKDFSEKSYYINGKLKFEVQYSYGWIMNYECFNKLGKPLDKGTLSNGDGHIYEYDDNGKKTMKTIIKGGVIIQQIKQ